MLSILFYACSGVSNNHRRQVRQEVETFAQAYFNFNFSVALDHCSKESGRWIRFAASNITAEDIAQWAGTISYEVLLAATERVHRRWIHDCDE